MPSSLQLNWELFSAYKNHTTLKGLVDISPGGITPLVDLYLPLKDSGIVSITFLLGQMFICPNLKNIKLTHVTNILLTVDADTLNNWARWSSGNPCLSLHMTKKNSSRGLKDLALPFFLVICPHCNQTQCCCQFFTARRKWSRYSKTAIKVSQLWKPV